MPPLLPIAISTISPLTLNCPLPSIKSYLTYPRSTNFFFTSSKSYSSPTLNFNSFLYKISFFGSFCDTASIVVITIKLFFDFILCCKVTLLYI